MQPKQGRFRRVSRESRQSFEEFYESICAWINTEPERPAPALDIRRPGLASRSWLGRENLRRTAESPRRRHRDHHTPGLAEPRLRFQQTRALPEDRSMASAVIPAAIALWRARSRDDGSVELPHRGRHRRHQRGARQPLSGVVNSSWILAVTPVAGRGKDRLGQGRSRTPGRPSTC